MGASVSSCPSGPCFFNATCGASTCTCDSASRPDDVFFHDANCALPEPALLVVVVLSAAVFLLGAARVLGSYLKSEAGVRTCHRLCLACTACLFLQPVGVYVQDGFHEMAAIMSALSVALAGLWLREMLKIVLTPLVAARIATFGWERRETTWAMRVGAVLLPACFVALACVTWLEDAAYNTAAVTTLLCASFISSAFLVYFMRACAKLVDEIEGVSRRASTERPEFMQARHRLEEIRFHAGALLGLVLVQVPFAFVHLGFGSAPFSWVVFASVPALCSANVSHATHDLVTQHATSGRHSPAASLVTATSPSKETASPMRTSGRKVFQNGRE